MPVGFAPTRKSKVFIMFIICTLGFSYQYLPIPFFCSINQANKNTKFGKFYSLQRLIDLQFIPIFVMRNILYGQDHKMGKIIIIFHVTFHRLGLISWKLCTFSSTIMTNWKAHWHDKQTHELCNFMVIKLITWVHKILGVWQ